MNPPNPEDCKPDLEALIDAHIQGTHSVLSEGCKSFCPKLIVQAIDPFNDEVKEPQYIYVVIADDFNEPDVKHGIMKRVGGEIYHKQMLPLSVSLASECWLSNNRERIAPSEADDRREAIVISALGIEGSGDMQVMPFKRDKEGKIIEGPFVRRSGGEVKSPLLASFYRGFWDEFEKREKGMRR